MPRKTLRNQSEDSESSSGLSIRNNSPDCRQSCQPAVKKQTATSKRAGGIGKKTCGRADAIFLKDAHNAVVADVKKTFGDADSRRAQLKAAKQSNYGKLRALVEDAEGEATTKSFLEHAKALVHVGERVLKEYDELENSPANTDRLQLEKGPLMERWDLDYQGLCHVFVAGRHYGEKVVQNLVVPSRLGESNELRLKDREGATEMDELAEEMFDSVADHNKSPDDSWGAVALGHLRTWAGVVKGAKSSGASFNEETSNMLGLDQGDG